MSKLYTEEQVRQMLWDNNVFDIDDVLDSQIPIQLPTTEKIKEEMKAQFTEYNHMYSFYTGAKWMRDKIKGGEDE